MMRFRYVLFCCTNTNTDTNTNTNTNTNDGYTFPVDSPGALFPPPSHGQFDEPSAYDK